MNLFDTIKSDRIKARSESVVKYETLTLVMGEVDTIVKRNSSIPDDSMVTTIINKLVKSCRETNNLRPDTRLIEQINILQEYLPKQMTEDEIKKALLSEGIVSIPEAHKMMKSKYQGKYDPASLNSALKSILS